MSPSAINADPETTDGVVHATLNFYRELPVGELYPVLKGATVGQARVKFNPHTVPIHDMRSSKKLSIDANGFALVPYTGSQGLEYENFNDDGKVRELVYPEVKELLRKETGATEIFVFQHMIRRSPMAAVQYPPEVPDDAPMNEAAAVPSVHTDYSTKFGYVMRDLMESFTDPELLKKTHRHRWAFVNVWKPLKTVLREPLALCDGNTVRRGDLRPVKYDQKAKDGQEAFQSELYYLNYKPDQKWYWPREQEPNEALVFKQFDSAMDGRARVVPHTAIKTPDDRGDPRESVEFRSLVVWEDDDS